MARTVVTSLRSKLNKSMTGSKRRPSTARWTSAWPVKASAFLPTPFFRSQPMRSVLIFSACPICSRETLTLASTMRLSAFSKNLTWITTVLRCMSSSSSSTSASKLVRLTQIKPTTWETGLSPLKKTARSTRTGPETASKKMMGMLDVPDCERCMVLDFIASNINGNNVPPMPLEECFPMAINSFVYSLDSNRTNTVSAYELEKFITEGKKEGWATEEDVDNIRAWMDEKKDKNGDVAHGDIDALAR